MVIVLNSLLNCRQGPDQKVSDYVDRLRTLAETIDHHGGKLRDLYPKTNVASDTRRDLFLASLCIQNADKVRFGVLIANLANQFLMGHDEYPDDLTNAQGLLTNYQVPLNNTRRVPPNGSANNQRTTTDHAATFAQAVNTPPPVPDNRGRLFTDVRCYNCNALGHYAGDCPTPPNTTNTPTQATETGTTLLQHALVLAQHKHKIDPNWILLDSQSTISVFNNPKMLTNIRDSGRTLRAITNGGYQDSTHVGDFPNLGEVWFNAHSIANILSLSEVSHVCRVTMDTHDQRAINVHRNDGSTIVFSEHPSGLYVYDSNVTKPNVNAYTLVNTVTEQKKLFTPRQVKAADTARALYRMIGRPSETIFQRILRNNQIHNCPVTPTDAARALAIYGPDVPFLKGTTTKTLAAPHIPSFEAVALPPQSSTITATSPYAPIFLMFNAYPFSTPSRGTLVTALRPLCLTGITTPSCPRFAPCSKHTPTEVSPSPTSMATMNSNASARTSSLFTPTSLPPTVTSVKWNAPSGPSRSAFALAFMESLSNAFPDFSLNTS